MAVCEICNRIVTEEAYDRETTRQENRHVRFDAVVLRCCDLAHDVAQHGGARCVTTLHLLYAAAAWDETAELFGQWGICAEGLRTDVERALLHAPDHEATADGAVAGYAQSGPVGHGEHIVMSDDLRQLLARTLDRAGGAGGEIATFEHLTQALGENTDPSMAADILERHVWQVFETLSRKRSADTRETVHSKRIVMHEHEPPPGPARAEPEIAHRIEADQTHVQVGDVQMRLTELQDHLLKDAKHNLRDLMVRLDQQAAYIHSVSEELCELRRTFSASRRMAGDDGNGRVGARAGDDDLTEARYKTLLARFDQFAQDLRRQNASATAVQGVASQRDGRAGRGRARGASTSTRSTRSVTQTPAPQTSRRSAVSNIESRGSGTAHDQSAAATASDRAERQSRGRAAGSERSSVSVAGGGVLTTAGGHSGRAETTAGPIGTTRRTRRRRVTRSVYVSGSAHSARQRLRRSRDRRKSFARFSSSGARRHVSRRSSTSRRTSGARPMRSFASRYRRSRQRACLGRRRQLRINVQRASAVWRERQRTSGARGSSDRTREPRSRRREAHAQPQRVAPEDVRSIKSASSTDRGPQTRFYLQLDDDVVDGPSIGPKTAARLYKVRLNTVRDLLTCDCDEMASQIEARHITADVLRDWKDQARLVCVVPNLRGTHAQILVGAGYRTVDEITAVDANEIMVGILQFASTSKGQSVLRSGQPPELEKVLAWVDAAHQAEPERAAA